jgi:hypothetical protein
MSDFGQVVLTSISDALDTIESNIRETRSSTHLKTEVEKLLAGLSSKLERYRQLNGPCRACAGQRGESSGGMTTPLALAMPAIAFRPRSVWRGRTGRLGLAEDQSRTRAIECPSVW